MHSIMKQIANQMGHAWPFSAHSTDFLNNSSGISGIAVKFGEVMHNAQYH